MRGNTVWFVSISLSRQQFVQVYKHFCQPFGWKLACGTGFSSSLSSWSFPASYSMNSTECNSKLLNNIFNTVKTSIVVGLSNKYLHDLRYCSCLHMQDIVYPKHHSLFWVWLPPMTTILFTAFELLVYSIISWLKVNSSNLYIQGVGRKFSSGNIPRM